MEGLSSLVMKNNADLIEINNIKWLLNKDKKKDYLFYLNFKRKKPGSFQIASIGRIP